MPYGATSANYGAPATWSALGSVGYAQGVAVDSSSNVYIADNARFGNVVKETLLNGNYTQSTVVNNAQRSASSGFVTVDAKGNVYSILVGGLAGLYLFESTLQPDGSYNTSQVFPNVTLPISVAVDSSGNVYIVAYMAGPSAPASLLRETPSGSSYTQTTVGGTEVVQPVSVAVDSKGNVYVALKSGTVLKETPSGSGYTYSTVASGLGQNPVVAVDANFNIYIASDGTVVRETPVSGGYVQTPVATSATTVSGVAADSSGNVYIANGGKNVQKVPLLGFALTATENGAAGGGVVTFSASSTVGGSFNPPTCTLSAGSCTTYYSASGKLAAGNYPTAFTASFPAVGNYTAASATGALTITLLAPTTATVSAVSAPYNSTKAITVTATESGAAGSAAGGTVTFGTGGGVGGTFNPTTCTLGSAGSCTTLYTPSGTLNAGTYSNDITASFSAVGNYAAASAASTLTITPLTPVVTYTNQVITYPSQWAKGVNDNATVTLNGQPVNPALGTLSYDYRPTFFTTAPLPSTTVLPPGSYVIDANWTPNTGQANYAVSSASALMTINPVPITVTAASPTYVYGQTVAPYTYTITATYLPGQSQAQVVSGVPSLSTTPTSPTAAGSYTITVAQNTLAINSTYSAYYAFKLVNGTLTISPAKSAITAPASNVVLVGSAGSIPVTVAATQYGGSPTGSVSYAIALGGKAVSSGTAPLTAGAATIPVPASLAAGIYSVSLNYAGDSNFQAAAQANVQLTVTSPIAPTVSLSPATAPFGATTSTAYAGQSAWITVASNLGGAGGMAVDASGNVYIVDGGGNVWKATPQSNGGYALSTIVSGLNQPAGVAVDASGNVFISTRANTTPGAASVVKETLANGQYTQSTVASGLTTAIGVAVDAHGNIYVACYGNTGVLKYLPSGSGYTQSAAMVGSGLTALAGVAVDSSGNVYIAAGNSVLKETPQSNGSYSQSTALNFATPPAGVAVDSSGNLFVSDQFALLKETLLGGSYTQSLLGRGFCSGTFCAMFGAVAVDSSGNVYSGFAGVAYRISLAGFTVTATEQGNSADGPAAGGVVTFSASSAVGGSFNPPTCTLAAVSGANLPTASCTSSYTASGKLAPGSYSSAFTASFSAAGAYAPASATGALTINQPVQVACPAAATGELGVPYDSGALKVTGGAAPYTFVTVGTLVSGLSLNSATGEVTGTPASSGSFQIGVKDALGATATSCKFTINAGLTVACPSASTGSLNVPFNSGALHVTGGLGPFAYSIVGTLPAGLTLNTNNGAVSGTPTAIGSFAIKVTDALKATVQTCPITIYNPSTMLTPAFGSVLKGPSQTFIWTQGTGVTQNRLVMLEMDSLNPFYDSGMVTGKTSATVTGIPTQGLQIEAALYSVINGVTTVQISFFTEETSTVKQATLVPCGPLVPGQPLTPGTYTVKVQDASANPNQDNYMLVGTGGPGANGILNTNADSSYSTQFTFTIPGSDVGQVIFVQLGQGAAGVETNTEYAFQCVASSGTARQRLHPQGSPPAR